MLIPQSVIFIYNLYKVIFDFANPGWLFTIRDNLNRKIFSGQTEANPSLELAIFLLTEHTRHTQSFH